MEGIVTCIKHSGKKSYYIAYEYSGVHLKEIRDSLTLNLKEIVEFNGSILVKGASELGLSEIEDKVEGKIEKTLMKNSFKTGVKEIDKTTEKMWESLSSASSLLLKKLMLGAPILVRFHNDADGSSGATGIYRAVIEFAEGNEIKYNIIWTMHTGAIYLRQDAESDILSVNNYESVEKPLLLLIDFGTSSDSNQGIEAAEKKFDIIWLEHHPIEDNFNGKKLAHYINPWMFGSDSNYSAGTLACIFSQTFSKAKVSDLISASLIGDHSKYSLQDGKGSETALILDLMTSDVKVASKSSGGNLTPPEIDSILSNAGRSSELYGYATLKLNDAMDSAITTVKVSKGAKGDLYQLDYTGLRGEDTKYPLPGRFASRLLDRLEELGKKPCVLVVHHGAYISVRISDAIGGEIGILEMIKELKEMFKREIDSGGGHRNAASMKLREKSMTKGVLRHLMGMLRKRVQ